MPARIIPWRMDPYAKEYPHPVQPPPASSAIVSVNGLVYDFCARALEKVFGRNPAVSSIDVDLHAKRVTLHFHPHHSLDNATLTRLISDS